MNLLLFENSLRPRLEGKMTNGTNYMILNIYMCIIKQPQKFGHRDFKG